MTVTTCLPFSFFHFFFNCFLLDVSIYLVHKNYSKDTLVCSKIRWSVCLPVGLVRVFSLSATAPFLFEYKAFQEN